MKKTGLLVSLALSLMIVSPARAAESSAPSGDEHVAWAVSDDGTLAVALRLYDAGGDSDRHSVKLVGADHSYRPVGVLVQNTGDVTLRNVGVEIEPDCRNEDGPCLDRLRVNPYPKKALGFLRSTERDVDALASAIDEHRSAKARFERTRRGRVFYLPILKPHESYYGDVFIVELGKNGKGRSVKSISGRSMNISMLDDAHRNLFVASMPLAGGEGRIFGGQEAMSHFRGRANSEYVGPSSDRPSDDVLLSNLRKLEECSFRASAALADKVKKLSVRDYSSAIVSFDKYGDQVSNEPLLDSNDDKLNSLRGELVESLKRCELVSSAQGAHGTPYYRVVAGLGDAFPQRDARP